MAKQTLPNDFKEFLKLLNEAEVQYLLIGGYAAGYQWYNYVTHIKLFENAKKKE